MATMSPVVHFEMPAENRRRMASAREAAYDEALPTGTAERSS